MWGGSMSSRFGRSVAVSVPALAVILVWSVSFAQPWLLWLDSLVPLYLLVIGTSLVSLPVAAGRCLIPPCSGHVFAAMAVNLLALAFNVYGFFYCVAHVVA